MGAALSTTLFGWLFGGITSQSSKRYSLPAIETGVAALSGVHEKVMFIPVWELAFINGQGPRVQESGLGLIPGHAYSAPYEDVKLKGK